MLFPLLLSSLRLSPLERSKRNLSSCARKIRAPLSSRHLEQSKRNLLSCVREIQAPLSLSPLEKSERNLSSFARLSHRFCFQITTVHTPPHILLGAWAVMIPSVRIEST
ncbi:hypothetical protein J6590_088733 [Homalodisca vitripennis]|nr:hypothetical protein J6590_088733 [Homalodisca vitripennis]